MRISKKIVNRNFYHFDKNYGFWGIPNVNRLIDYPEYGKKVTIFHDAEGNRTTDPDEKLLKATTKPILFLGGSHTWGAGVENSETYPALIQQLTGLDCLNYGHCSFGLDQMALVALRKMRVIKPQAVVIELHPWVIHRVLRKTALGFPKPYFFLEDHNLKLRKINQVSMLPIIRYLISNYLNFDKQYKEFVSKIDLGDTSTHPLNDPLFKIWNQNYYSYLYELLEKIIVTIRDEAAINSIQLIFVLGPTKQELMAKKRKIGLVNPAMPRRRVKAILEANSVNFIDMYPNFEALKGSSDNGMFMDGHINNYGHEIFANRIYERGLTNA